MLGRDLATNVAPDAGFDLEALPSAGSAENVKRMRFEPGVKFAIVQSDVYQAFVDQANLGNKEAGTIIRPLRVILPLYNEEIYFVARSDSPINFIHEIKDARINAGPLGSGTALTALTMYQARFHTQLPAATTSHLSNEDALIKLTTNQGVDVVAIVGGQPMKLLADMKPGFIRFPGGCIVAKCSEPTSRQRCCNRITRTCCRKTSPGWPSRPFSSPTITI